MQPRETVLVDYLIDRKLQLPQQFIQPSILLAITACDVGSFTCKMLAMCHPANSPVQCRATVATVHIDRLSIRFP